MSSERRKPYPFDQIEPRWQQRWAEEQTFHTPNPGEPGFDPTRPKYYVLDMFPYPSGSGLHVGHPEGYTATDIIARFKRMCGFNVLHPMGWDAFGLPAEQHAIKTGEHPAINTQRNVDNFRGQLQRIGFAYDWQREVNTTDPGYFKWTQWIFLQLYGSWFNPETQRAEPIASYKGDDPDSVRLAYVAEAPVNWCPELGTVLANEEVIDGRSEVGGHPVERRAMRQWMLRITKFAQRLIDELEGLDWPVGIKLLQKNWIGRSDGAEVHFSVADGDQKITVFTTRPDTLYGATYMVLAPEHRLVDEIVTEEQLAAVEEYRERTARKSDLERTELAKEKSGKIIDLEQVELLDQAKGKTKQFRHEMTPYSLGVMADVRRGGLKEDLSSIFEMSTASGAMSLPAAFMASGSQKLYQSTTPSHTGVSDPYEAPANPEVSIDSSKEAIYDSVAKVFVKLKELDLV